MGEHISGKVIVVTGAASGFGRLLTAKLSAAGASVVATDVAEEALLESVDEATSAGGTASAHVADVTDLAAMRSVVATAVERFGAVDVIINNAGVMPLAFYADHARAAEAWDRCIDVNLKGVLNGIIAAHDQMIEQGRGHVVNLSSIYGNHPVAGAAVYGATKAAVSFLSDALRVESQGRIKVTTIRPTGVPGTGLGEGIVNPEAIGGILGTALPEYMGQVMAVAAGEGAPEQVDPDRIEYLVLDPELLADQIVHTIDQPWGVSISDVTVRASGDRYLL
ncbi:MAG: SDR family oxidoreductase [Actinomycetota bacterium]